VKESLFLDLYRSLGVRVAPRPEAPESLAPLGFADIPAEYAAAREGCAFFDQTDRGSLRVSGADAQDFLHRMLSNHVRRLEVARGNRNLLLSPKGKVLFDLDLMVQEGSIALSTPPGRSEALRSALDHYLFQEQVSLSVEDETHAPLDVVGPRAPEVLEALLGARPTSMPRARFEYGGVALAALPVFGSPGFRIEAEPGKTLEVRERLIALGALPAGLVVRDSLRVENGCALSGVDVDENVYPQEAGLEEVLADDKGCFVGQEVVAKIDTYGGLNKRLMALRVDHEEPVPRGTRLLWEPSETGGDLGMVTTWAYSFALDSAMVLAYVKRRHQDPGTVFLLSGDRGRATIVPLPVRGRAGRVTSAPAPGEA